MKQTAVEWLAQEITKKSVNDPSHNVLEIVNKAKEMEEQNTIEILERYHNSLFIIPLKEGEAKEILKHLKK